MKRVAIVSILALTLAVPASAATITYVDLGTGAPPATLGGQTMTAFPADPQGGSVTSVASPLGETVDFSQTLTHTTVGVGWLTWSHGYTGDVYHTAFSQDLSSVTLTLPSYTSAFYFYGEPNVFQTLTMTATASDGTTSGPVSVFGDSGARGFGFYSDMTIASITVTCTDCSGFAVGEFGIAAVPEPATLLLLGTGLAFVAARARRRSRKPQA